MIKAVIFDLDGTIVDSIDIRWRAFNAGVAAFKLEPVPKEGLMESMNSGARLAEILGDLYPALKAETGSPAIDEIIAEIRKRYPSDSSEGAGLASGARELFNLLRLREIRIGVVTNRVVPVERILTELGRLRVAHFIDAVVTAAEGRRKPAPDPIIECLNSLELLPEECVFVGDSQADMLAGKAARVRTVAVTTGVAHLPALAAESPDFIFDSLHSFIGELDMVLNRY